MPSIVAIIVLLAFAAPQPVQAKAPDEEACDRLTAVPYDADKPADVQEVDEIEPKNIRDALSSCERAARSAGAHRRMWLQYGRALEFAQRTPEAVPAYEKAAEAGSTMAMLGLSDMYASGRGVAQDSAKAIGWLEKAANAGNPAAMNNLGAIYGTGEGVEKDFAKARGWYEKAAAANFPQAQYQLGLMALEGQGVPKNAVAAKAWFEKAAAQNDADSLYELGLIYAKGLAGLKDEQMAKRFLSRAALLGSEDADKALHRLNCPFNLKSKDGKEAGDICFDGPVTEIRPAKPE
jgi:TPR repeat protein